MEQIVQEACKMVSNFLGIYLFGWGEHQHSSTHFVRDGSP